MANLSEGIVLYQIEKSSDELPLVGTYDCLYFDHDNEQGEVDLIIALLPNKKGTYKFTWVDRITKKQLFEGVGYKMNAHQLVVHYKV